MPVRLHFFIIAAVMLGAPIHTFGRQSNNAQRVNVEIPWVYHPNRLGVEAYMQGGAFVATTNNITSVLFNPAGLAQLPGRLVATVESGWASDTEYLQFFDVDFVSGFQPLQFAGIAFQPGRKLTVGAFYARPTYYKIDAGRIGITSENNPDGIGEFVEPVMKREQTSVGLALSASFGEQLYLGGGVEWRRSSLREDILNTTGEGDADAVRFSVGAILQVRQWYIGLSAQTRYKAAGDVNYTPTLPLINVVIPPGQMGNNNPRPIVVRADGFRFSTEDPATMRFGLATPYAFDRLRFSADAEYKNFKSGVPIERWQFYGGGIFTLTSDLHLGFGAFTFAKDYSAFIEGPESETFWTAGGTFELSQFRFSASFMDSDLLTKNFAGQQFFNFAIGYVIP